MSKVKLPLLILLILFFTQAAGALEYTGYVTDNAGVFSAADYSRLTDALTSLEKSNTVEFAVLTVSSLEGEDIDSFRHRIFNEWKIGKSEKDNGLLLVIAIEERKYGLEVGYGLEGIINDSYAGRLMRKIFPPYFKQGLYFEGVYSFINVVHEKVTGEVYDDEISTETPGSGPPMKFSVFSIFILLFVLTMLNSLFKKFSAGIRFIINFIIVFIFTFLTVGNLILAIIISVVIALAALAEGGGSTGRRGYFYTSHDSGFGGSSGGFGGFGGGSSGGGGASGSW